MIKIENKGSSQDPQKLESLDYEPLEIDFGINPDKEEGTKENHLTYHRDFPHEFNFL